MKNHFNLQLKDMSTGTCGNEIEGNPMAGANRDGGNGP